MMGWNWNAVPTTCIYMYISIYEHLYTYVYVYMYLWISIYSLVNTCICVHLVWCIACLSGWFALEFKCRSNYIYMYVYEYIWAFAYIHWVIEFNIYIMSSNVRNTYMHVEMEFKCRSNYAYIMFKIYVNIYNVHVSMT